MTNTLPSYIVDAYHHRQGDAQRCPECRQQAVFVFWWDSSVFCYRHYEWTCPDGHGFRATFDLFSLANPHALGPPWPSRRDTEVSP